MCQLPTRSTSSTVIVYEQRGHWAAALRHAAMREEAAWNGAARDADRGKIPSTAAVRVVEVRTADDCLAALSARPRALVAIELRPAVPDATWELLASVARDFPAVRAVVLADVASGAYQWLARELGAVDFVTTPRRAADVLELAVRHEGSLPQCELSLAEEVWESLPWGTS